MPARRLDEAPVRVGGVMFHTCSVCGQQVTVEGPERCDFCRAASDYAPTPAERKFNLDWRRNRAFQVPKDEDRKDYGFNAARVERRTAARLKRKLKEPPPPEPQRRYDPTATEKFLYPTVCVEESIVSEAMNYGSDVDCDEDELLMRMRRTEAERASSLFRSFRY